MPYYNNKDLPASVRHGLTDHAQDIYRAAFNHAFETHKGERRQEEAARRIGSAAVKRRYAKTAQSWIAKISQ